MFWVAWLLKKYERREFDNYDSLAKALARV